MVFVCLKSRVYCPILKPQNHLITRQMIIIYFETAWYRFWF